MSCSSTVRSLRSGHYITVGPIFSLTTYTNTPPWVGLGVESTYVGYVRESAPEVGVGLFLHLELTVDHFRFAVGPQVNAAALGTEVGIAWASDSWRPQQDEPNGPRVEARGHRSTWFLHFGPFVSGGFMSLAGRFGVPFTAAPGQYGFSAGGSVAFKGVSKYSDGAFAFGNKISE